MGGSFDLRYRHASNTPGDDEEIEATVPRTVRSFVLDRFEVTWNRFAEFVFVYDQDPRTRPAEGDGAHPAFPGSGWQLAWAEAPEHVPVSQLALETMLKRGKQAIVSQDEHGDVPVRGVNWYVAMAFCIWEGGRLPTEAEWTYAAVGGQDGDRLFPWVPKDLGPPIDHDAALFSDDLESHDSPAPVGSFPAGESASGQQDLAGNMAEWVADAYRERLAESCADGGPERIDTHECMVDDAGSSRRVQRGGSYSDGPKALRNTSRSYGAPDIGSQPIGFRCAHEMPPRNISGSSGGS